PLILPMDAQRVGQVLINLLNNAIKFTPAGGVIRVRSDVADDHVVVRVEDSGLGIAPEDLPKLFNRFSQLEAGRRKKTGVGLGLNISKSIIEAHGGRMGVQSEVGKGTTFWFSLPYGQSEAGGESRD
ncbi:MAG TPA: ATP-binding protein, partial [Stenomitos sp.]